MNAKITHVAYETDLRLADVLGEKVKMLCGFSKVSPLENRGNPLNLPVCKKCLAKARLIDPDFGKPVWEFLEASTYVLSRAFSDINEGE